uniref:Ribonuclease 3 n=1 Tax=candidate division WOR-3 bacterium TaxID=2052148 RepID=A0A7V3RG72_UNCW3
MDYQKEHSLRLRQSPIDKSCEKRLKVKFRNKRLLKKALTHISAVAPNRPQSNEVLEFLGDAVLELIVREYLMKKFPKLGEGELSQLKKKYTSEEVLYRIGKRLGIGEFLIMDRGEELSGGRNRRSNITSCLEALFGALYLDHGLDYTKRYFKKIFLDRRLKLSKDYKSILNDWAMKNKKKIEYVLLKEIGPPHQRIFQIGLYVDGKKVSEGKGLSKKEGEKVSARIFLKKIGLI